VADDLGDVVEGVHQPTAVLGAVELADVPAGDQHIAVQRLRRHSAVDDRAAQPNETFGDPLAHGVGLSPQSSIVGHAASAFGSFVLPPLDRSVVGTMRKKSLPIRAREPRRSEHPTLTIVLRPRLIIRKGDMT
jgi:hypothetical protein